MQKSGESIYIYFAMWCHRQSALTTSQRRIGPMSTHRPYLSVNLLKAISAKVLYDTGADISCWRKWVLLTIPPQQWPAQKFKAANSFHGDSWQAHHISGTYDVKFKIRTKNLSHLVHIIWNLHKDSILGIDFIHSQKLAYCPASLGEPWWQSGHARVTREIKLDPCSVTLTIM